MESSTADKEKPGIGRAASGIRIDLHCHSIYSRDGRLSIEDLVKTAIQVGLGGFALTDHDTVAGHEELQEHCHNLLFIPGCEVTTAEGHILAYGVDEAPPPHRSLAKTVEIIREQGGIPVLAHPFRFVNGVKRKTVCSSPKVAVEGINGRSWQSDNLRAMALARELGRPLTGGSDAHISSEVGRAWTLFPPGVKGAEEALKALRRGEVIPGGKGVSLPGLIHSKALGTRRWLARQIGEKGTGDPRGRERP